MGTCCKELEFGLKEISFLTTNSDICEATGEKQVRNLLHM